MECFTERDHEAQEHLGGVAWATVSLWRPHHALVRRPPAFVPLKSPLFSNLGILFQHFLVSIFVIHYFYTLIVSLNLCRTIYNMCKQPPPHNYCQQLYDKYRETFEEHISSTVSMIWSQQILLLPLFLYQFFQEDLLEPIIIYIYCWHD